MKGVDVIMRVSKGSVEAPVRSIPPKKEETKEKERTLYRLISIKMLHNLYIGRDILLLYLTQPVQRKEWGNVKKS